MVWERTKRLKYVALLSRLLLGWVWIMPQKVFCQECGSILYHGLELETPMEIIQRHNGICPQCKRKLDFETEKVKIAPNDGAK